MASIVITPAVGWPLTAAEVKAQCRIDGAFEDAYIEDVLIPAVCLMFERETGCYLLTTVVEDRLPCWPRTGRIDLGRGEVSAITSVTYRDADGASQTLPEAAWQFDPSVQPASVYLAPGATLPSMQSHPAALRVRYVAGFGADGASVPRDARLWLLLHVGHFWINREAGYAAPGNDMKPLLYADRLIDQWRRVPI